MGPKGILISQKQIYYDSDNLNNENIQGELGKHKEIKVSFGKVYRPCCHRADTAFGTLVSPPLDTSQPITLL